MNMDANPALERLNAAVEKLQATVGESQRLLLAEAFRQAMVSMDTLYDDRTAGPLKNERDPPRRQLTRCDKTDHGV